MCPETPEVWKPVVGYEGSYEVSDQGNVRSLDRWIPFLTSGGVRKRFHKGRLLRVDPKGRYLRVTLLRHQHHWKISVHTLVCTAFHGIRPNKSREVRHLNGNALDNRAENLRWGTHSENMLDRGRHGTDYWLNRTECVNGHPWTEENTYRLPSQRGRTCKECTRIAHRDYYQRRKRAKGMSDA